MNSASLWRALLALLALATATISATAACAATDRADGAFAATDEGNGEVLLEWLPQRNAVSYRVERSVPGIATTSFDAGNATNAMDVAGLAPTYSYRLFARAADGTERETGRIEYSAPATVMQSAVAASGKAPHLRSPLGTNLEGVTPWSTELPFVDVMKSSGDWISGDRSRWDNGGRLDVDANGWVRSLAPGQIAKKLMLREIGTHYPGGQYVVRYQGEGTLNFQFAARVVSQRPGRMVIQVTPGNDGVLLEITATNPLNYVRDIEVIMPGGICEGDPFRHVDSRANCNHQRFLPFADYANSIIFYPPFAARLRGYSVLRFMDWMATNGSEVRRWSQRTPLAFHTWAAPSGVPPEVMIALANRLGAQPWFNMPHASDDEYSRQFAQTVKARLAPSLGVYVEYSNEVWNAMFRQHGYALEQGKSGALDNMQYYAQRADKIGRIFKQALGAARVVAVLGAQAVNPWTATRGLDYLKSRADGASVIDAIAIAPYFAVMPDPAAAPKFTTMSLDAFFDHVQKEVVPAAGRDMEKYAALAKRYHLHLIAYEGGQHMVGILGAQNDDRLSALFDAFNRDSRIKDLYLDYLARWKQAGGELFVHFNDVGQYSKWGRWGALEDIDEPRNRAPKFDALQTFIEQNGVWWNQETAKSVAAATDKGVQ